MNYSLENAKKFNWSSINGDLNPERVSHLENYLIGNKILDAGCGGGAYVEYLARKGLEVIGIDKHEFFLQVARNTVQNGSYLQGDLVNLPFPDKIFDCTYCFDVLEHINDILAIHELVRVTKNRLIIAVPKEDDVMIKFSLTFLHYQDKTHLRNYTEETLKSLFSSVKIVDMRVFPELAIPAIHLVREMIDVSDSKILAFYLFKKMFNFFLIKILKIASYKKVYTGLVAIIDLQ
jgi:ubiquinone/menaquinone biosynthesis C-methylase UbiE